MEGDEKFVKIYRTVINKLYKDMDSGARLDDTNSNSTLFRYGMHGTFNG